MKRLYRSIGSITLGWLIGSCGGGGDSIVGPPPPTTASVTISSDTATLVPAASVQLSATAKAASGEVLQRSFSWTSSDVAKATVSSSGVVAGVSPGTAIITAAVDGKSATATVTVLDGGVVSGAGGTLIVQSGAVQVVVPANALASNTNLSVAASNAFANDPRVVKGTPFDFGPTGTSFTKLVVLKIKYDVANLPPGTEESALEIYFHDPNSGWQAVPGSTVDLDAKIVSAEVSHFSTYAILIPQAVATVTVTPSSASVLVGGTQQLTATLRDAGNNVLVGRKVTWTSSNPAQATVDANGLVTGVAAGGPVTITATSGAKAGASSITVNPVPVATVTLSAPATPVVVGGTQVLTATPKDGSNNTLSGRTVSWVSSNPAVLSVSAASSVSTSSGAAVTVTAVSPGTATLTATSESAPSATTPVITVNPAPVATVTVTPPSASLVLGITPTQQLTPVTKDANGAVLTGRTVTWTSSNLAVATVEGNGLVTAVGAGSATITATSETKTGTSSITVTLAPVATVTVSPATASLVVGITPTQQLTAVTKDANGTVLTGRLITWTSSNTAAATVDGSGLVTAVGAGSTTITATSETKTGTSSITVTLAPVATVTLSAPTTPMVVGGTQVLTATLKDASNNTLTGRTVRWVSSNTSVLTVSPASSTSGTATVTAVAVGTATITAASESASSLPTPVITVTLAPVATVTVSPPSASSAVGVKQQLTALLKDANNNTLIGRVVTWTSSNAAVAPVDGNGLVTGLAIGGPVTITATSETKTGTSSITVTQAVIAGPLRVSTVNPRYFVEASGRVVYLTGSEYWKTIQDDGTTNPPPAFDYSGFLAFLQRHNHNFTRLYMWEQARWSAETSLSHWFSPTPYLRPGSGIAGDTALDGGPKFDVSKVNPAYLARVRQRVIDAGARGIYVSVMLFDGWSVGVKGNSTAGNPWLAHPFNAANNINGIDGDPTLTGRGAATQTLSIPAITAFQDAYVKAIIDQVNDLDNVTYEISNESDQSADSWQYHMIDLIRSYEATKPKQHPIGMTVPYPTVPQGTNSDVLSSTADWVSMNGDVNNPTVADGSKVSLSDTDHLCGICGDAAWPWRSLTRGHNPLLMDGYDGSPGVGDPLYNPSDPIWEAIRTNMGYARSYALRMDLAHALPSVTLASSGYCLAVAGSEYLVFLPSGGSVTVDLSGVSGSRAVEWFNPSTGLTTAGAPVTGGNTVTLTAPFAGAAVVYIHP